MSGRLLTAKKALVAGMCVCALVFACGQQSTTPASTTTTPKDTTAAKDTSKTDTTKTDTTKTITGTITVAALTGDWVIDTIRAARTTVRSGDTTTTDTQVIYSNDSLYIDLSADSIYTSAVRNPLSAAGRSGRGGTYGGYTGTTTASTASQITYDTGTWSLSGTTLTLVSTRGSAYTNSVKYYDSLKSVVAGTYHVDTAGLTSAQLVPILDSLDVPYDTTRYPRTIAVTPTSSTYLDSMKTILADSFHVDTAGLTGAALTDTLDSLHLGITQRTTTYTDSLRTTGFGGITSTGTTAYTTILTNNRIVFSTTSGQSAVATTYGGGGGSTTVYAAHLATQ